MQQQLNLKDRSLVDLKVAAYDIMVAVQNYNQLLQAVNAEIAEKTRQAQAQAQNAKMSVVEGVTPEGEVNHQPEASEVPETSV